MSEQAIRIENIGKMYILSHRAKGSESLVASIGSGLSNVFKSGAGKSKEEFWALQGINAEIKKGERVGVIGRNGAGKSTLLKILSRVVKPSTGRIEYEGRMASLLEVGTGFHGDLSGRENIYLNGSILGMSKREIDTRFDEIVAFSEVEQFLDTPVKRYSSGMYVRLAFAIAAHLEPEILIVDEVLAVGDAAFQKKCLGKMEEVSQKEGRTILFVSHNMATIQNLCNTCMYLSGGRMIKYGKTEDVIPEYLRASREMQSQDLSQRTDRSGNGKFRFMSFGLKDTAGQSLIAGHCGTELIIEIFARANTLLNQLELAMGVDDQYGQRVAHFSNLVTSSPFEKVNPGDHCFRIRIPRFPLKSGNYTFSLYSTVNGDVADWIQEAGNFDVEAGDFFKTGKLPPEGQAAVFIEHHFEMI
ncbi:MAG TPA: ABC transporter ATP-binding protein [Bacteroidia bacterium]|nr:ABC transporter ATP-binding protein [Bacteroidia bacterium]